MVRSRQTKKFLNLPTAGLLLQLFIIILLPLTLLLVGITFGSIAMHQRAMRTLVGERDERAVRIAAQSLSNQIDMRIQELGRLSQVLLANSSQPLAAALAGMGSLPNEFNAGVAVFDSLGRLLIIKGDEQVWNSWINDASSWEGIFNTLAAKPGNLIVYPNSTNTEYFGLVSDFTQGNNLVIGAFSISLLARSTLSDLLPAGGQLSILMVDSDQRILYREGDLSDQSSSHPGVSQALQGQSGTTYVKVGGDEHVTAYTPVTTAGWALITEESWEEVATPTLSNTLLTPLVLVPAVFIMLLALYLGANQVVRPLRQLESKARTLAQGDFTTIQQPVGGITEIQHLQKELMAMANKVREAQRSLHRYIGAITAAQEDERRRVARELHDDTLQALIALKQRVQLAQLELQPSTGPALPQSAELEEIASFTEHTIENLRRLTRDLRPVYLEDLGLAPALEVLARDVSQATGMAVEFHHQGTERRLDPGVELALYRMAQEACNNIIRHAQASQASVSIEYSASSVTLKVEDNGVGFALPENSSEYASSGHYGLLGLHERAELINAVLDIRTSPGKGTCLVVSVPT